jgi:single-strand DNA-binding protein
MASANINRVIVTGNLTRDPELRNTPGGTSVCKLRIAVNSSRKNASGEWEDKPNYFDVTVWGAQGENCATYLSKGRPVAIDGRLDWHEWEQDGNKRQAVEIIADRVQFLGSRDSQGGGGNGNGGGGFAGGSDLPADTSDFSSAPPAGVGSSAADDDSPFYPPNSARPAPTTAGLAALLSSSAPLQFASRVAPVSAAHSCEMTQNLPTSEQVA